MVPLCRWWGERVRLLLVLACLLAGSVAPPLSAREVTDSVGRKVTVPDRVERVMAAGPNAAVLLYVLAPEKMIGWPNAPRLEERPYMRAPTRDLPEHGRLTGRGDTANIEVVLQLKPDLVFDFGTTSPTYVSLADRVQQQTGLPYLLIDGRLELSAASVRLLGGVLGVPERAEQIARYMEETEKRIDERLKDVPESARRRVYLARQANGLETGLRGSINTEILERAGGVNVAERGGGRGGIANVSVEQLLAWAPDTVITWDRNFFVRVNDDPVWAQVPAVKEKRVYLSPRVPFGWIDAPPSVNRFIGLRWIASLLYPERFAEDFRADVRAFYQLFYQIDLDAPALERLLDAAGMPATRRRR
jgi:iron complex transport system substrate-binding protein